MAAPRNDVLKDLALAVGWAVFVSGGIALGLALGSLGADVPADSEMLVFIGVIAAVGTLAVRLAMVGWKYRGAIGRRRAKPATAGLVEPPPPAAATAAPARPAPTSTPPAEKPARTRKPPAEKPAAKKPAARKPPSGGGSARRPRSS